MNTGATIVGIAIATGGNQSFRRPDQAEFDAAGSDRRRAFPSAVELMDGYVSARKPDVVGDEVLIRSFSKFDEDAIRIAHECHFVQYLAIDGEARPFL